MNLLVALLITIVSTLLMFTISHISKKQRFIQTGRTYLDFQLSYQSLFLILAMVILAILYIFYPQNLIHFLKIGNIEAPAKSEPYLGIGLDENWLSLGLNLTFFITFITAIFVYIQLKKESIFIGVIKPYIVWILLFSLMNAFSEEVVY